jgi:hypothetical protein
MRCVKIAGLFCLYCVVTNAHAEATYITADTALVYDSNIGRAQRSIDIDDDFALEAGLTAARSFRLSDKSGLMVRAGAQVRQQFRFQDLSLLSLDAGVNYRIQPVVGFTNPWIELALDLARLEFRDSRIRDGWIGNAGVTVGKYFTDRIRTTAGWNYEARNAEQSQVFDWHHNTLNLAADYRFTENSTLYTKALRIYGDQVSTVRFPYSASGNYQDVAKAVAPDTALGDNPEHRAYRIGAITNVFEIGMNYAVKGDLALDFSLQHYHSNADGGNTYNVTGARAGLLYRF